MTLSWQDEGFILNKHSHGENSFVITVLTQDHGRVKGLWRSSGKLSPQIGVPVTAQWRARLESHLGHWRLDPYPCPSFWQSIEKSHLRLMGLMSAVSLCEAALPERAPAPEVFSSFQLLHRQLHTDLWADALESFEQILLKELGWESGTSTPSLSRFKLNEGRLRAALGCHFPSMRHTFGRMIPQNL